MHLVDRNIKLFLKGEKRFEKKFEQSIRFISGIGNVF
jgi:hypothetical protein